MSVVKEIGLNGGRTRVRVLLEKRWQKPDLWAIEYDTPDDTEALKQDLHEALDQLLAMSEATAVFAKRRDMLRHIIKKDFGITRDDLFLQVQNLLESVVKSALSEKVNSRGSIIRKTIDETLRKIIVDAFGSDKKLRDRIIGIGTEMMRNWLTQNLSIQKFDVPGEGDWGDS